jgi:hypothetical protein
MHDLIVHIGYPKTGTTSLQKLCFEKQNDIYYLTNKLTKDFYHFFYYSSSLVFERYLEEYISTIDCPVNRDIFFSTETITGISMVPNFLDGGMIQYFDPILMPYKINLLAKKLNRNVKIIITTRKQEDIILSLYAQVYNRVFRHLKQLNTLEKYIQFVFNEKNYNYIEFLNYDLFISQYEKIFGIENIQVLLFEELKQDNTKYFQKFLNILQIDLAYLDTLVNNKLNVKNSVSGYKTDKISLKTLLYPIKTKYFSNINTNNFSIKLLESIKIGGTVNKKIELSNIDKKKLKQYFANSNKILAERYNLSMKEYNYYD